MTNKERLHATSDLLLAHFKAKEDLTGLELYADFLEASKSYIDETLTIIQKDVINGTLQ